MHHKSFEVLRVLGIICVRVCMCQEVLVEKYSILHPIRQRLSSLLGAVDSVKILTGPYLVDWKGRTKGGTYHDNSK